MDFGTFKIACGSAIEALKMARTAVDEYKDYEQAKGQLERAQELFNHAQAGAAKALGYEICRCSWPALICTSIGFQGVTEKFKCPACGSILPPDLPPLDLSNLGAY